MRILFVLIRNLFVNAFVALRRGVRAIVRRPHGVDYVKVELKGELRLRRARERQPFWLRPFFREAPTLSEAELAEIIERVGNDARVKGLVVVLREPKLGMAQLVSVRARLEVLRGKGKAVVVWAPELTTGGYFLASVATHVALAPGGHVDLRGLAAEVRFYKAMLDKLPARAEVIAAGRYKNAFDPFSKDAMTPEHREALGAVLDDFATLLTSGIARGRGLSEGDVRARMDDGPYVARRAFEAGLVDSLAYEDDLEEALKPDAAQKKKAKLCAFAEFKARATADWSWKPLLRPACLGVVSLRGTIHSGESRPTPISGATAGDRTVCAALEAARKQKRVRAVVLHIDSRGGSSLASDLMWHAVRRLAAEKPVVAHLGNYAASGGYYVACACDEVVASPGTITGSIGVLAGKLDLSGLWARLGVRVEVLRRGARGDLYSTHRGLDDAERARLGDDIAAVYDDFVSKVAQGRKLEREAAFALAEGRVWTGTRAHEHKLVDALGTFDDALARARARAGFKDGSDPPVVVFAGPARGPFAWMARGVGVREALAHAPVVSLAQLAEAAGVGDARLVELSMLANSPYLYWCPFEVEIR